LMSAHHPCAEDSILKFQGKRVVKPNVVPGDSKG
jgi:hypothetical protein